MRGGDVVAVAGDHGEGGRKRRISDIGGVRWNLSVSRRIGERVLSVVVIGGYVSRPGEGGGVGSVSDGVAAPEFDSAASAGGWVSPACMLVSASHQYSSP